MKMQRPVVTAAALCLLAGGASASDRTLVADPEFRAFLAQFEEGAQRFMNGDTSLWKANVTRRPDVLIMGGWGAYEKGWPEVSQRYDWAGARFKDSGAKLSVEYLVALVGGDFATTTAIERAEVHVVGQDKAQPMALRVTHVFRKEESGWKLVVRHADPLLAKTAPEAVLKKSSAVPAGEAAAVVAFWREAGPGLWFAKDADFDRRFRERFLVAHEAAARGELADWAGTAEGAMALVILLDQYPRNAFRGTARMYDTDALARRIADAALQAGHDQAFEPALRLFLYLPFGHSEDRADQERSVALNRQLGSPSLSHAIHHRDIIVRFGRFPHRNPILGRPMREDEQHYLDNGGFKG